MSQSNLMLLEGALMKNSIRIDGVGSPLRWFDPTSLTDAERAQLRRLIDWKYSGADGCYWVKRKAPHKIGRVICGRRVLSVVPDMSTQDFTTLFLYSLGADVTRFVDRKSSSIALSTEDKEFDYSHLLAALMATACEGILATYVAKSYERRTERLTTLRGRVDWLRSAGAPKHLGLSCEYHEITTQSLLNQVVLQGLGAALSLAAPPSITRRLSKLEFVWQSLGTRRHVTIQDINSCERSLNRLTEGYRTALALCRMLIFGVSPGDFFRGGRGELQTLEFDLSGIFERFAREVMKARLYSSPLYVRFQSEDGFQILDDSGALYQKARPDFSIEFQDHTLAVLDAKFKPRYVTLEGQASFTSKNRLSPSDVYQMLFYVDRARARGAVQGYVICPLLDNTARRPTKVESTIVWRRGESDEIVIQVVDVNIPETLHALRTRSDLPRDGLAVLCDELLASCVSSGRLLSPSPLRASS